MGKYQIVREIIKDVMKDGMIHTAEDLHRICEQRGIEINKNRSEIYNTVYQLKKKGIIISDGRNGYLLADRREASVPDERRDIQEKLDQRINNNLTEKFDLSEFEIVKPAIRKEAKQVISVLDNGDLVLNSVLSKILKTNKVEIHIKKDCSHILLVPDGEILLNITKNNRIKNYQIYEKLKKKKVKFPVYYVGEWDDENRVWMGELVMINPNKTCEKLQK